LRGAEIEKPKHLSPQIAQIDADRGKAKKQHLTTETREKNGIGQPLKPKNKISPRRRGEKPGADSAETHAKRRPA
jgi:hypothetical protein